MPFIVWDYPDSDKTAWFDYIPGAWLELRGEHKNLQHITYYRKSKKKILCYCDLIGTDSELVLSYDDRNASMFAPGKTIVRFRDSDRDIFQANVIYQTLEGSHDVGEIVNTLVAKEGAERLRNHKQRERDDALVRKKKDVVLTETGKLACEACTFDFEAAYGDLGFEFCEVHHDVVIAGGERITTLDELSIVCSNCHRMIHVSALRGPMLTVKKLHVLLKLQQKGP